MAVVNSNYFSSVIPLISHFLVAIKCFLYSITNILHRHRQAAVAQSVGIVRLRTQAMEFSFRHRQIRLLFENFLLQVQELSTLYRVFR
jgi:IS4 transposase